MPVTYIMCGLAFSGKSSIARRVASELGATLISLDAINHERNLRGGEGIPISEWERTSHIAMQRLETALRSGASVVVDDTFSHRFLRDRARSVAEGCGSRFVILYMDTPIAVIEERRAAIIAIRPDTTSGTTCSPPIGMASSIRTLTSPCSEFATTWP